jgi:hypothetical protein
MGLLFVAYAFGVGLGVAAFERGRSRPSSIARSLLPGAIATAAAIGGALLLHGASRSEGRALSAALAVGGSSYLLGLAVSNRTGLALRLVGFVLIFGAALVPSTLTLVLPIVALLASGLNGPAGRRRPVRATAVD